MDMYNSHECEVRIVEDNLFESEAFNKEKELISYYRNNTDYRITNMTDGGEGTSGYKRDDIQKKSISNKLKKMWKNDEFRQRMTDMRNAPDSIYQSREFRDKISKLVKGCQNPNYNHRWNQEQKDHLSQVRKTNNLASGTSNPKATAIMCLETGEVFDMVSTAQIKYGIKHESSLSIALRDKKRLAANKHWRYFDVSLLNEDVRFLELLKSLYESEKYPICSPQTKETFNNRKDFLNKKGIGIKKFNKIYLETGKYVIDNNEYLYVKDFLSRYM